MKKPNLVRTILLAGSLLLCAWPEAGTAQAATATAVAWGLNDSGQTDVPVAAQSGVTAIAAGDYHTVALKNDGSVVSWGHYYDSYYYEGEGYTNDYDFGQTTVPVAAQSGVTAIAAGSFHTVALKSDGSVLAWRPYGISFDTCCGYYSAYNLGQTNVPVAAQSGVTAIAAGQLHTVALKTNGSVVAWGYNASGETTVPVAAQSGVTAIAAGSSHTVALKNDGSVVAWGWNGYGQTTVPVAAQSGVTAIAAGDYHTVALKNDGSVVAWGWNGYGQTTVPVAAQSGVTAIAAGLVHTVALKNDGSVVAWGYNYYGQTTVPVAAQSGVTAIAAGSSHTVVILVSTAPVITTHPMSQTVNAGQSTSFTVAATGYSLNYQWRKDGTNLSGAMGSTYGLGNAWFNDAGTYTVVVSNSAGSVTSTPPAVLTVNAALPGSVVAWGDNYFGQTTVPVAAQSGVTAIAAGSGHTVVLKTNGSVVAWGHNGYGQTTVPVAAQSGVTAIESGGFHTVALKNDGSVLAWGDNYYGQTTVPVAAQSGVTAIAAGWNHTVALKTNGSVLAWGRNDEGQTTVPVAAQSGVTAIAAGWFHTVALKNDGSVVSWGHYYDYDFGQTTVPVAAQSGVTAIAAGSFHTVALKSDGSVLAWRPYGFTYDADTDYYYYEGDYGQTNVPVAAQSGVTAIAAGYYHTVALKNDGSVLAWGAYYGQTNVPVAAQSGVTAIAAGYTHTVALLGPALPQLTITRSGANVILSWPADATGFTLQSTTNLFPTAWFPVAQLAETNAGQISVTVLTTAGRKFFRLQSQ